MIAKSRRVFLPRIKTAWAYLTHKVRGTPYASFYARMMDVRLQYNPTWGLTSATDYQLEFLKTQGLDPSMHFLDYGCGAAAAGQHFIRYLDPGHYTGADVSEGVLAEAQRRIAEWGLDTKEPNFLLLPEGRLDPLVGRRFNIIWAQSVLTHMPPEDIRNLLSCIAGLLEEGGAFYATFARGDVIRQSQLKDWYYPVEAIFDLARGCGLRAKLVPTWRHPDDPAGTDTLARITT